MRAQPHGSVSKKGWKPGSEQSRWVVRTSSSRALLKVVTASGQYPDKHVCAGQQHNTFPTPVRLQISTKRCRRKLNPFVSNRFSIFTKLHPGPWISQTVFYTVGCWMPPSYASKKQSNMVGLGSVLGFFVSFKVGEGKIRWGGA